MSRTTVPVRAAASRAPAHTAAIPSAERQPAGDVEQRAPADLDVADAVGGLGLDELGGDPLERLGVLHERDRQVERAEQLGLVGARHRRDERGAPCPASRVGASIAARARQLERGVDPERAVEVEVELGLGHRLDQARGGVGAGRGPAAVSRVVGRVDSRPPMLRIPRPMSTILVTGASGFVGSHPVPALLAAGHRVVALVRDADGRRARPRRGCAGGPRRSVEIRIGDVTRPETLAPALAGVDAVVHLAAIPRDFNGGADLRLVNTEGTRAVVAAMRQAGVRRLVHMGAMGVEDDPTCTTRARRPRPRRSSRDSGLDWTILKPSLQFGPGDGFFNIIAGLVRLSPGHRPGARATARPASSRSTSTTWRAVVVRVARRPDDRRRGVRARRAALLDVPRDHRARSCRASASGALILPMPVPLIRLVAGTAELVHLPFPVATDQLRQLRLDNIGPLDLIPTRFGFEPRPMEGALGYLARRSRGDQVVARHEPDRIAQPSLGWLLGALGWLPSSSSSRSAAAGLVDRRSTSRPGRPAGPS